jgi:hypothetical protein
MKFFDHIQVSSVSNNRDNFTTREFHINSKGKTWVSNKCASIILSILSRIQNKSAIPLPWIIGSDNSCVDHENTNIEFEGRNSPSEEEVGNYKVPKLKSTKNQLKSQSKEYSYLRDIDQKVVNDDSVDIKAQNESIGLSKKSIGLRI